MPDVFATWPKKVENIRSAGVANIKAKATGDAAYYDLGVQRDPKMKIAALYKPDTVGRPRAWGFKPELTAISLESSLAQIQSLPVLLRQLPIQIQIELMDGLFLQDDGSKMGLRWRILSEGDFNDFRKIEYSIFGNLHRTELDALVSAVTVALGSSDPGDGLVAFGVDQNPANQAGNGFSAFKFKAKADAALADFGEFNEGKYVIECLGPLSGGGRQIPRTTAIRIMVDIKGLQTTLTEIELMDAIHSNDITSEITHMDGVKLLLPSDNFGMVTSFNNEGNADGWRTMDAHIEGILTTDPTGLIFQTVEGTPTVWEDLWS